MWELGDESSENDAQSQNRSYFRLNFSVHEHSDFVDCLLFCFKKFRVRWNDHGGWWPRHKMNASLIQVICRHLVIASGYFKDVWGVVRWISKKGRYHPYCWGQTVTLQRTELIPMLFGRRPARIWVRTLSVRTGTDHNDWWRRCFWSHLSISSFR